MHVEYKRENLYIGQEAAPVVTGTPYMNESSDLTRRTFVGTTVAGAAVLSVHDAPAQTTTDTKISLQINGVKHDLTIEPRVTLLDALRERLQMTGSKKGCDHGQCGACTVLVNGRRTNSCLKLAISCEGDQITTIEGLAEGTQLHPVQAAFIKYDGFQCGYCTPGQICSAVGLLNELSAQSKTSITDEEIQEQMSGNICRCGAYPNIVAAVREAHSAGGAKA